MSETVSGIEPRQRQLIIRDKECFFDGQERQDMYDLVEWVAGQLWSDSNVGMIGISSFATTQLEAAT
jgi:predicted acyl esterase